MDTDGSSVLNGEINHEKLHIQIRESMPSAKKREVILHEILLVFRNLLIAKGYDWDEENKGMWRELINSGLDGEVY